LQTALYIDTPLDLQGTQENNAPVCNIVAVDRTSVQEAIYELLPYPTSN